VNLCWGQAGLDLIVRIRYLELISNAARVLLLAIHYSVASDVRIYDIKLQSRILVAYLAGVLPYLFRDGLSRSASPTGPATGILGVEQ